MEENMLKLRYLLSLEDFCDEHLTILRTDFAHFAVHLQSLLVKVEELLS